MTDTDKFQGWAILELMGHRRLAGWVTETELAGQGVLRLDVPRTTAEDAVEGAPPDGEEPWLGTQYYSPAALYCMTPCDEASARAVARYAQPTPIHRYELSVGAQPVDDVEEQPWP